jgi:hypothetical protein
MTDRPIPGWHQSEVVPASFAVHRTIHGHRARTGSPLARFYQGVRGGEGFLNNRKHFTGRRPG